MAAVQRDYNLESRQFGDRKYNYDFDSIVRGYMMRAFDPWLPKGRALERALEPTERRKLAGLLDLLHAAGMVHGFVDREHVYVDDTQGTVSLRFPRSLPNADHTIDQDRLAAARL